MDINSLLSPQDSPASEEPPNRPTQNLRRDVLSASPHGTTPTAPPQPASSSPLKHGQFVKPSTPSASPSSTLSTDGRPSAQRSLSTAGMDALADLASMQHHQHSVRTNAISRRSTEVLDNRQKPPSPKGQNTAANSSMSARGSIDHTMTERPPQPPSPRAFSATSMSASDLEKLGELTTYLVENHHAFEQHIQLVNLLRAGYIAHQRNLEHEGQQHSSNPFELLQDLRKARDSLSHRYAVGEDLWADWIEDEISLAQSVEEKVALLELIPKALEEEVGSIKLWLLYGNWMYTVFDACHPERQSGHPKLDWSSEDIAVGQELFRWNMVLDIWKQGVEATKWRINDSNILWDRFIEILTEDLNIIKTQQRIGYIKSLFSDRLQIPHMTWNETFQKFSSFITQYDNSSYEDIMTSTNKKAAEAKMLLGARDSYEERLQGALTTESRQDEWQAFSDYIDWETTQSRKNIKVHLCIALYERALLRFGQSPELWQDLTNFLEDKLAAGLAKSVETLPVLSRSVKHCPWSGSLWSEYILCAERSGKPFDEIEDIKHKATSSGLLDAGGMEEVLKVHNAWCEYLKRRAFYRESTDEELDVAEVGIRSALESVKQLGENKYGSDYKGDPSYRLENIYIQYLSQCGQLDPAREVWKSLIPLAGHSYEFWIHWYDWEMINWARNAGSKRAFVPPTQAASILRQASTRSKLDWPEKILEKYLSHAEEYDSASDLVKTNTSIWKLRKSLLRRREKEAQEAANVVQLPVSVDPNTEENAEAAMTNGKRKRSFEEDAEENSHKKSRQNLPSEEITAVQNEAKQDQQETLKRDREHTTVVVKNLPPDIWETRIRQFFRDCGKIISIKLSSGDSDSTATASVEFDSRQDVLAAQTKDMKAIDGRDISVELAHGSTVFVTNFPSAADEKFIREVFAKFGDILDIRFPSLKYNTHRRFCYVQFKNSRQAAESTAVDGQEFEGNPISVKISAPEQKQDRSGAIYEGREVYVSNVDWNATEDEINEIFSKYGQIERIRIPRNVAGKSKGVAFVVFNSKDAATASLDLNSTKFKSRILTVAPSTTNPVKKNQGAGTGKEHDRKKPSRSPAPATPSEDTNASKPSTSSENSLKKGIVARTVVLLNIPDTINDSRIRTLMEPHGEIVKIRLRPDHAGALVEFRSVNDAGKAALAAEDFEIVPGRRIRIGSMEELRKERAEFRSDRIAPVVGKKKKDEAGPTSLKPAMVVRPVQGAGRGGGYLGAKRPGAVRKKGEAAADGKEASSTANGVKGDGGEKSNADFRAMFLNEQGASK